MRQAGIADQSDTVQEGEGMRGVIYEMFHETGGRDLFREIRWVSIQSEFGPIDRIPVSEQLLKSLKAGDMLEIEIRKAAK